jgi:hypothetical protein
MKPQFFAPLGMFCGLVTLGVVTRLVPHPPNCTAIGAVALFGAAVFPRLWQAMLLPLAAMFLGDLGLRIGFGMPFCAIGSYICFTLTALAGRWMLQQPSAAKVVLTTLGASVMFFVVSNFGVWIGQTTYTHDWAGLVTCYAAAVPFFRNMLAGNFIFGGLLFGMWEASRVAWPQLSLVGVPSGKNG